MSSVVGIIVPTMLPSLVPAMLPVLGVGAAVATAGVGVYVAYRMMDQLHKDYQAGLEEYHARAENEVKHLAFEAQGEERQRTATRDLLERAAVTGLLDANRTFLLHRVTQLLDAVAPLDNAALLSQCEALRAGIEESSEPVESQLEALRRLAEAANAAALPTASAFNLQIASLRDEINAPLLDTPETREVRDQLLEQLASLKKVAVRQRIVAQQGLDLLRRRVYREMQAQAEIQQERLRQAEARRLLVGGMSAKLHALVRLSDLPTFVASANLFQQRLAWVLATGGEEEMDNLQALARDTDYLFETCERTLQQHLVTEYVSDQVSDVLSSMGYHVRQVEQEEGRQTLVANLDNAVGVEFQVGEEGRLGAEMVALTPETAVVDQESQEKVCGMIDQVIDELKKRQDGVRERFRSTLQPGEALRVVDAGGEEETTGTHAELKKMRIDES